MNPMNAKPVASKSPHASMRIGKRHAPEDDLVVSGRAADADTALSSAGAVGSDAAGPSRAATPPHDRPRSPRH